MTEKYAPVIIATLNRSEHFIRLVESLKRNTWAHYTDVYIGLDYPPSEKYVEGYNKIRQYLSGDFSEFASFEVIRRTVNYGSLKNFADLRTYVLERYDRFIRTDDDAEFSPNFLEYMNKCLDMYEFDEDVVAVCGYTYPLQWNVGDNATIFKESFICPMWGTGFWRDKYTKAVQYISNDGGLSRDAYQIVNSGKWRCMTDVCKREFADLCLSPDFNMTLASTVSDISFRMYLSVLNKSVIMPVISKVRNWGFDGTGEFCSRTHGTDKNINAKNYNYSQQQIDEQQGFVLIPDSLNAIEENKRLMNRFDPIPFTQKLKMYVKLIIYMIFGKTIFTKITLFLRKIR